jgi:hypothetical protein
MSARLARTSMEIPTRWFRPTPHPPLLETPVYGWFAKRSLPPLSAILWSLPLSTNV